jgi:uncharacterized protein (DUF3084 family)
MANESGINGEQESLPLQEQLRQLQHERDCLQKQVKEIEQEREQLRQTLAVVQKERDQYLNSLYGYVQKEYPYEKALEDFKNIENEEQIPFSEVIAECEQLIAEYERSKGT